MKNNVTVIIPVFNEAGTLAEICRKVLALPFVAEVIAVDDASSDDSWSILSDIEDQRLRLLQHRTNQGKTAAILTGLQQVTQDIVVIQDADLEYDPAEIEHLCRPIWDDVADVVYGSRFLVRKASRVLYYYHYVGNCVITVFSNLLTNKNMTDVETCFKAFRTFLLQSMPITSRRFGFEVEVTAKISKTAARIFETPISYYGRTYEQGKKITYRDGLYALWYILRYNLSSDLATKQYVKQANGRLPR